MGRDASSGAASRCAGIAFGDALDAAAGEDVVARAIGAVVGATVRGRDDTASLGTDVVCVAGDVARGVRAALASGVAVRPRREVAPILVSAARCAAGADDGRVALEPFERAAGVASCVSGAALARIGIAGTGATDSGEPRARTSDADVALERAATAFEGVRSVGRAADARCSMLRDDVVPCDEAMRCAADCGCVRAALARANCVLCVASDDGIAAAGEVARLLERRMLISVARVDSAIRCTVSEAALRDAVARDERTARWSGAV